MTRLRASLGLAAGLIVLLAVLVYRTRSGPTSGPVSSSEPLRPETRPRLSSPVVTEEATSQPKDIAPKGGDSKPPPEPKPPEAIRTIAFTVNLRVLAPPAPEAKSALALPCLYTEQFPIPVELTLERVPGVSLPKIFLTSDRWKAAISVSIASETQPESFLLCDIDGWSLEPMDDDEKWDPRIESIPAPTGGFLLRGRVQPPPGFQIPGRYRLQTTFDVSAVCVEPISSSPQRSPIASFEVRPVLVPEDRIRIMVDKMGDHLENRDFHLVIASAQAILKLKPTSVAAYYDQAIALWKSKGDLDAAIASMEQALRLLELNADAEYADRRTRESAIGTATGWIEQRKRERR